MDTKTRKERIMVVIRTANPAERTLDTIHRGRPHSFMNGLPSLGSSYSDLPESERPPLPGSKSFTR